MKRFPLLLLSLINVALAQAQEKQVIPPSPNVEAFTKYGNIPVSYHTGTLNVTIPIYTIQVRDVSVPISLSYHTGGIRVSEEASRVGLGWSLNAGGLISRTIYNEDDFASDPGAWLSPFNNSPPLPNGPGFEKASVVGTGTVVTFVDKENGNAPYPLDLIDYIYGASFDYEPDHFNFNFLGHSGKFVMGRDRVAILERQEKISLVPDINGKTWEVKTEDGYKYTFGKTEYVVDAQGSGAQQTTAWYLTRIESPVGEVVDFEYAERPEQFIRPIGLYQERLVPTSVSCPSFACTVQNGTKGPLPRKTYSNIILSRIVWKLGKVEFETSEREDLEGDLKVDKIKVFSRDLLTSPVSYQLRYVFRLDYGYFDHQVASTGFIIPDVSAGRLRKRLKLNAVRKFSAVDGGPNEWSYTLGYHESTAAEKLPAKNSFARDHWGYYNGRNNTSLIPTYQQFGESQTPTDMIGVMGDDRDPSAAHMKAYSLREIVYPTGGRTTFHFEANDYDFKDEFISTAFPAWEQMNYDCIVNEGEVRSTLLDFQDQYVSTSGNTVPIEISAAFRSNQLCDQLAGVTGVYFEIVHENGLLVNRISLGLPRCEQPDQLDCIYCNPASGGNVLSYKGMVTIPPGKYYWRAFSPNGEHRIENIAASIKWWVDSRRRSPLGKDSKIALAGGLRIKQIDDFDPLTGLSNHRTFEYHYSTDENVDGLREIHSHGKRMATPRYSYFDLFWEVRDLPPGGGAGCLQCISLVRQADSFVPATGSHSYSVGYDKVIEKIGLNGEGGWTEYEFHNVSDDVLEVKHPHSDTLYQMRSPSVPTIPDPLNGLQKSMTHFRSDGVPVRKLSTTYSSKFHKSVFGLEYRRISAINFDLSDYSTAYYLLGDYSDLVTLTYPSLQSALIVPTEATEIYFDSAGHEALTKTTRSFYENTGHLQLTRSTTETSDGRTIATSYKYAADFNASNAGDAILEMKGVRHLHNIPIEVTVANETDVNDIKILSRQLTIVTNVNGRILPTETAILNNAGPVSHSEVPPYVPSQGYDAIAYHKIGNNGYSPSGNLQWARKHSDHPVSYLWGYDNTLPIAEITNALVAQGSAEVFHENFEENPNSTLAPDASHTGRLYWPGDYAVNFSPPNSRSYKIEYWYRDGNAKWKHAIKPFSGPTTLTEGVGIDNVRIYPTDAVMKTYTYDPGVGMTSMILESGLTIRYDYDSLGRLSGIRNDDGSLERAFLYNYRGN